MSIRIACSACGHRLKVPDRCAGRKVMCPACDHVIHIPLAVAPPAQAQPATVSDGVAAGLAETLSHANRAALSSLVLALLSIQVLCIPYVGYLAIVLSGVGLLLGLGALVAALFRRESLAAPALGVAGCLAALTLALLPLLRETPPAGLP